MNKKEPIQAEILEILSGKKAVKADEIIQKVGQNSRTRQYSVTRGLRLMEQSGQIERLESDMASYWKITSDGKSKLRSIKLSTANTLIPVTWDGMWRIVLLDVPENRKNERNAVRYILKKAGFACLKNAVWISPLPLEHVVIGLKEDMNFTNELMVFVTNTIDESTKKELEKFFK